MLPVPLRLHRYLLIIQKIKKNRTNSQHSRYSRFIESIYRLPQFYLEWWR